MNDVPVNAPRSPRRWAPLLVAVCALLGLAPAPASAGWSTVVGKALVNAASDTSNLPVTVCYYGPQARITVAVAYYDSSYGGWTSEGWYGVDSGDCRTVLRLPADRKVYLYAQGAAGSSGGGYYNCTGSGPFTIHDADKSPCVGGERKGFEQYVVGAGGLRVSYQ